MILHTISGGGLQSHAFLSSWPWLKATLNLSTSSSIFFFASSLSRSWSLLNESLSLALVALERTSALAYSFASSNLSKTSSLSENEGDEHEDEEVEEVTDCTSTSMGCEEEDEGCFEIGFGKV